MSKLIKSAVLAVAGTLGLFRAIARQEGPSGGNAEQDEGGNENRSPKARWKRRLKTIGVFLILLATGGLLVAASGIVPIKASSGHWAITRWFLSFGMHRSVATHSLGITTPPLDDPALVLKGAGHYETACRSCHGSPDLKQPRIAAKMTPHPPYLPPVIREWKPKQLFYIVKHGVKFTGMPAWPALERDDEVWAMVAFLLAMPELDAAAYLRLAWGDISTRTNDAPIHDLLAPAHVPRIVTQNCGRCHGIDGLGRGTGAFPKLAGQAPDYLLASLQAYERGERHSGIMEPLAAGLTPDDMRALALYYARQPMRALPSARRPPAAEVERGRRIVMEGVPAQGVPSCQECHGPGAGPRNPFYPLHAGQYANYLELQLRLFKELKRGGTPFANIMNEIADRLTEEQMRAVALYYESLADTAVAGAP